MTARIRAFALLALWLTGASAAEAHLLNMTRVSISHEGDQAGELQVEIDLGQSLLSPKAYWALAIAPDGQRAAALAPIVDELAQGIVLSIDGSDVPKRFVDADLQADSLSAIRNPLTPQMATLRWTLPATAGQALEVSLRPDLDVPWPCLVRSDSDRRALPSSDLLTADRRTTAPLGLTEAATQGSGASPLTALIAVYTAFGFEHILPLGLDHLLFVIGLVLVGGSARQLALLLSCFTVAHSLTLASATLGVFRLPPAIVEPLIAASIVYVGLERLLGRSRRAHGGLWRYAVVFAFGLLHGLGFAQVLSEIGLPTGRYLAALLSFNVGVELGQLTVLAITLALLARWQRRPWYEACIATPGATVVAGTGLYWLVQRLV
ncbi:MAG: HupE/UreJ family protein [Pseudomonadota bacterium]